MEPEAYKLMNQREGRFWWHVGMQRIIDTQLRRYLPRLHDNVILDAGCGTGGVFNVLAKYGSVYGIDQSELAVKYAQAKNIAREVLHGSITKLPFTDGTFDLIVCMDVLYHARVGDDTEALREFYRVLRPGGILIVREPSYNWLRGHQDTVVWTKRRYSTKDFTSKIVQSGFKISRVTHVNCFLFPLALVKRLLDNLYQPKSITNATFRTNSALNFLFTRVLFFEAKFIPYINFPFGLSILCVAKKRQP